MAFTDYYGPPRYNATILDQQIVNKIDEYMVYLPNSPSYKLSALVEGNHRLLKHINKYLRMFPQHRNLYVKDNDSIITINDWYGHKVMPINEFYPRVRHCAYHHVDRNMQAFDQEYNFYRNQYYNCVDNLLACDHGIEY